MKALAVLIALLALSAPLSPAAAQSCTAVSLEDYFVRLPACASTFCTTNQPHQMRVDTIDAARSPLSCATATWNFDSTYVMGPYPATQAVEPTLQTSGPHTIRVTLKSGTRELVRQTSMNTWYGTFRFSAAPSRVSESAGSLRFSITRSNAAGATTCNWGVVTGGAGSTFGETSGTIAFPDGVATVEKSVTIVNDSAFNGSRSFTVQLSPPNGWTRASPDFFTVEIADDEQPAVIGFAPSQTIAENAGAAKVVVRRSGNLAISASVNYAIPASASHPNVVRVTGTLTFAPGETEKSIAVPILDDNVVNGDRHVTMQLSQPSPAPAVQFSGSFEYLRITDDEVPPEIGFAQAKFTVAENAGTATIAVTRTGSTAEAASVHYSVPAMGSTIKATSGKLTFAPGEATKSFVVEIADNAYYSGTTSDTWMYLSNATGGYFSRTTATLTVTDDEPVPKIRIEGSRIVEGHTDSVQAAFAIILSVPVAHSFSLDITLTPGTARESADYRRVSSTFVHIPAGQTRLSYHVLIRGDTVVEADEVFSGRITSLFSDVVVKDGSPATVTIVNDDIALAPSQLQLRRGTTADVLLDLGSSVTADTVIPLTSSNAGAAAVPESVTIPAGASRATFVVRGLEAGSARIEAVGPASHGAGRMSMLVEVHDGTRVVFAPASLSMFEGETAEVNVSLDPASDQPQTVELTPAAKLDTPRSITIPAGGSATFTVKALARGAATVRANLGRVPSLLYVDVAAAPNTAALAGVAPLTGPTAGGTPFEALGTRFTASCTLMFGGVPARNVKVVSESVISGVTPPHPAGTVDVVLDCNGDPFVLARAFTYIAEKPALRGVTPSFGSAGGGTFVRASGANFYSGCWLFFGDAAARQVEAHGTTTMTAVVPAGRSGPADVSVRCGEMTALLKNGFTYSPAGEPSPAIASIDPLDGSAGESVTITGLRFRPTDRITFGEAEATILSSTPDTHVVRIPDLPLGAASITLTDAAGRVTTTGPIFTILEPRAPEITRVSATAATAGSELEIEGRGFRAPYTFVIGGVTAPVAALDYNRAVIRVAAGTPLGTHRIEVRNAAGQLAAVGPRVDVEERGLTIASVSPACGSSEGGAEVVLTGTSFVPGLVVTLNGALAEAVFVNATTMRVSVPAGATGPARIAAGNATLTNAFRYVSPFDPNGCADGRLRRLIDQVRNHP